MAELDPWDRQPGETSKAYEAFRAYLELGPTRTIDRAAEGLDKTRHILRKWSASHGWVPRSRAWDSIPVKAAAEATAEVHARMARRIAEQHDRVATKLLDRLEANLDLLPTGADPTIRWSTAHNAARQGHNFATDLTTPKDVAREEITKAIEGLINKLTGE